MVAVPPATDTTVKVGGVHPAGENSYAPMSGVAVRATPIISVGTTAKVLAPLLFTEPDWGIRLPMLASSNYGVAVVEAKSGVPVTACQSNKVALALLKNPMFKLEPPAPVKSKALLLEFGMAVLVA